MVTGALGLFRQFLPGNFFPARQDLPTELNKIDMNYS